jgi:oligoribonuclease
MLDLIPIVSDRDEKPIIAGSSIHFDRRFMAKYMPELDARFSHQHYDVSSMKLFAESQGMSKFKKAEAHRAVADIDESIRHLVEVRKWLKENL